MDVKQITKSDIRAGDELQINSWGDRFTVAAVGPGHILASHGEEYTIIQRDPTDFGPYNGIPEGAIICGPDFWVFGWAPENPEDWDGGDGYYEMDNPEWLKRYMADLESGRTEVSMRRREMIERLDVYRQGVLVFETT